MDKRYEGCDIMMSPGGIYYPTKNGKKLLIDLVGVTTLTDQIYSTNSFRTKEEARAHLDRWLDLQGIGSKSVGL